MARAKQVEIAAEMVANVIEVTVEVGQTVQAGDVVILLESMKMEIPVLTETPGTIEAVKVASGDVVQEGTVMLTLT